MTDQEMDGLSPLALLRIAAANLRDAKPSRTNALAITKIEEAIHWLQHDVPAVNEAKQ